jgi:predicted amidohydrolase
MEALELIRKQIDLCESQGVEILCCPEAILGGLADYGTNPNDFAIRVDSGELLNVLKPLSSDKVSTIVGFTEITDGGRLFNSAAVLHRSSILGVYRKLYPAIRTSVYEAGEEIPIFEVGDLKFGIMICLDSHYLELARIMTASGATALFVPTNNGIPHDRDTADFPLHARNVDIARAIENGVSVIRADVAGRSEGLSSHGSSGIVDHNGMVLQSAQTLSEDLIVADINTSVCHRLGRNAESNMVVMSEYARLIARRCESCEANG